MPRRMFALGLVVFMSLWQGICAAGPVNLPPVEESAAFKKYQKRPRTELSKLIYLIDRYQGAPVKILYDRNYFESARVGRVVKKFLFSHYQNESAEHWINEYADRTDPGGNIILVQWPDGYYGKARLILLEALKELEQAEG